VLKILFLKHTPPVYSFFFFKKTHPKGQAKAVISLSLGSYIFGTKKLSF